MTKKKESVIKKDVDVKTGEEINLILELIKSDVQEYFDKNKIITLSDDHIPNKYDSSIFIPETSIPNVITTTLEIESNILHIKLIGNTKFNNIRFPTIKGDVLLLYITITYTPEDITKQFQIEDMIEGNFIKENMIDIGTALKTIWMDNIVKLKRSFESNITYLNRITTL